MSPVSSYSRVTRQAASRHNSSGILAIVALSTLRVVPDAGHNVHLERPAEFLRQLMPFLADTTLKPVAETPVPGPRAHAVTS